jgi:hypothetical protein
MKVTMGETKSGWPISGIADRWMRARSALLLISVVASTFVVTYVSVVSVRPLFAPDTRYYAAMSLWFGGASKQEAARQVTEMSARSGWATPPVDLLFGWGLVQPRVVLPALSVPFVKIWGIEGMVVVPGLAMAALIGVLTWMLARRYGGVAAAATVVLVMSSPLIMQYGSSMLTESLSALWGALTLGAAWQYQRHRGWHPVVWMGALTVVSGFTRQATLIPAGAFVTAWLVAAILRRQPKDWAVPALVVAVTAVAVQVLQTVLFPSFSQLNQFMAKTDADSVGGALLGAPGLAWRIAQTDLVNFARVDHSLLVLLTLSAVSMVVFWRRAESHLLLGAILGTQLYSVTNGTPTAFRYAMPGLVFFAASVALLISRADSRQKRPLELEKPAQAGRQGDAGRQGNDVARPGDSAVRPGDSAGQPGDRAGRPSEDAGRQRLSSRP